MQSLLTSTIPLVSLLPPGEGPGMRDALGTARVPGFPHPNPSPRGRGAKAFEVAP